MSRRHSSAELYALTPTAGSTPCHGVLPARPVPHPKVGFNNGDEYSASSLVDTNPHPQGPVQAPAKGRPSGGVPTLPFKAALKMTAQRRTLPGGSRGLPPPPRLTVPRLGLSHGRCRRRFVPLHCVPSFTEADILPMGVYAIEELPKPCWWSGRPESNRRSRGGSPMPYLLATSAIVGRPGLEPGT